MAASGSDITIRDTAPHELRTACDTMRAALLFGPLSDDDWAEAAAGWENQRSVSAWDGARCVGHAGALDFATVIPGGAELRTVGLTRVGVLPTHTRRGVLASMMQHLLHGARRDGAVLASLRASEATIYARFGFGVAGEAVGASIDPRRVRPIAGKAAGSFRLLPRAEVIDTVKDIYRRCARRPGAIVRPDILWQRYFEGLLDGSKAEFVVVHTSPSGEDDGFAHYSTEWVERPFEHPGGRAELFDLCGATPAVELALWDSLTRIDLIRVIDAEERPVDDVLRTAAADIRGYAIKEYYDEQWLRVLDVEAALRARSYRPAAPVTIAVGDAMFADNNASFRIAPTGITRVAEPSVAPDLTADIAALSAAYLGATSWVGLAEAGKVTPSDPEAAQRADDLFAHRPLAWCGSHF